MGSGLVGERAHRAQEAERALMSDLALHWDVQDADLGLASVVHEKYALRFADGSHVDLGDTLDLGTEDFRVKLRAKPRVLNAVQPLVAKYSGEVYLGLPGAATAYASTPHSSALATITVDLDVRVRLAMDDWTPASTVGVLTKDAGDDENGAWKLEVLATGHLRLVFTSDILAEEAMDSTAATGLAAGATKWIRATLDGNDGAGNHVARFYTSDDGSTWAQLGSAVTVADVIAINNATTARLQVSGAQGEEDAPLTGKVYYAEVRASIDGTVIAKLDVAAHEPGSTSVTSSTGEVWTIAGTAGLKPPLSTWQLLWDASGNLRLYLADSAGGFAAGIVGAASYWEADVEREIEVTCLRAGVATCKRDGVVVGTLSITGASGSLDNSLSLLFASNGNGDAYDGLMDSVSIWVDTFDSDGLEGRWTFNEGVGAITEDSSGNAYHGTLVDDPAWVFTGPPSEPYDLERDDGLETAVLLSLYTDRRAEESDVLPPGETDRRGWWGDGVPVLEGDRYGSRLWLLSREKVSQTLLRRGEEYAREALAWLVEDRIAERVEVAASIPAPHAVLFTITIYRPHRDPVEFKYSRTWSAQEA